MSEVDLSIFNNRGKRLTKPQTFALLRLLFEWDNAEKICNSEHPDRTARELLLARYGLDIPYATLYGLRHRWICLYDSNHNITEIVRGRFNKFGHYVPPEKP